MSGHRSDMMKLVKLAKKNGCDVTKDGRSHWKITTPSGQVFHPSFSPRSPGAYRDLLRDLRKAGVSL